jgi:AcrR family transcriptional regulator
MSPRGKTNPHTREVLLAAAEAVIRREGLAAATTRSVAREADVADGLLYNHFADKDDLLIALLGDRLQAAGARLASLPDRAGTRTVRENLVEIVTEGLETLLALAPLLGALMDRPDLRARQHDGGAAPDREGALIPARLYLEAERAAGRVRAAADVDAAAALLVGACHDLAFHRALHRNTTPVDPRLPARLVDTLMAGLRPAASRKDR